MIQGLVSHHVSHYAFRFICGVLRTCVQCLPGFSGTGSEACKFNLFASVYKKFERCTYKYVQFPRLDFYTADAACMLEGGHLASVHSTAQDRFITSLVPARKSTVPVRWIGVDLNVTSQVTPRNLDASPFDYSNFGKGEPNGFNSPKPALCVGQVCETSVNPRISKLSNSYTLMDIFTRCCLLPIEFVRDK